MFENGFAVDEQPIAAIRHEKLRRLHAYWDCQRQGEAWLPYARLRPEEIAFALADIALLERNGTDQGPGFQVRLAGETIRHEPLGFVRGKSSADLRPEWFRAHIVEFCAAAFARRAPLYAEVTLACDGRHFAFEKLVLPLVRHGATPDHLLMAAVLPQSLIDLKATVKTCLG